MDENHGNPWTVLKAVLANCMRRRSANRTAIRQLLAITSERNIPRGETSTTRTLRRQAGWVLFTDATRQKRSFEPMAMRTGQLWECRNDACGCEILVVAKSGVKSRVEPRCCCGSTMKKSHVRHDRGERNGDHGGRLAGSISTSTAGRSRNAMAGRN
jgi:hypothetical protein